MGLNEKFIIAVCGSHGKKTVAAMISRVIADAEVESQAEIIVLQVGRDIEIAPDVAVVTNIDRVISGGDQEFEKLLDRYEGFLTNTKQAIVGNLQDEWVAEVLKMVMKKSKVTALDFTKNEFNLELKIPGKFHELNAAAAFQVGLLLGIDPTSIRRSLLDFNGIPGVFEHVGSHRGRAIYVDSAYHPTEIKLTLEAAREKFPDYFLWVIFNSDKDTLGLFNEYVKVLKELPVNQFLIVGESSAGKLAEAVSDSKVDFVPTEDDLKDIIDSETHPGDVIFFTGAGDVKTLAKKFIG